MNEPQRMVDLNTGEVRYALVAIPRRRHIGGFFMAIQEGFRHLSTLDLTGQEYRVLAYFMAELDFENFIRVSQTEVAEKLGIDRANVSKAVKRFTELGIVHKGPRGPQGWTYQLDPSLGWKGRASRRVVALNERRRG